MGDPTRITSNFKDISEYFGIIKAKIRPPTNLCFPVLPFKTANDGILTFPLCRTCANEKPQEINNQCSHTDAEREIIVTLTTPEVEKAVSLGNKQTKQIIFFLKTF